MMGLAISLGLDGAAVAGIVTPSVEPPAVIGTTGHTLAASVDPAGGNFDVTVTLDGSPLGTWTLTPEQLEADQHNLVAPAIAGTGEVGETLTATPGLWLVDPALSLTAAHQWCRGATPISGATGLTYVLVTADAGQSITCRETVGSAYVDSNAISVALPAITGTGPTLASLVAGDLLSDAATWGSYTSSAGTITDPTTKQMQVNGGDWETYDGATLASAADVWRVREIVTDIEGNSRTFVSRAVTASGVAPIVSASDSLDGRDLTITVDGYTGEPTPNLSLSVLTLDGVDVSDDATGYNPWVYSVPSSTEDQTVAWEVTATNAEGDATASGSETVTADLSLIDITSLTFGPQTATTGDMPLAVEVTAGRPEPYTLYLVIVGAGAEAPTRTQIAAGTDGDDVAATAAESYSFTEEGTFDLTDALPSGMSGVYDAYFFVEDDDAEQSPIVSRLAVAIDTTSPTRSSAAVDGAAMTVAFSENLTGTTSTSDWMAKVGGSTVTISGVSVTDATVSITLAAAVAYGNTVTISYGGTGLADGVGNSVATFTDASVTNNTAAPGGTDVAYSLGLFSRTENLTPGTTHTFTINTSGLSAGDILLLAIGGGAHTSGVTVNSNSALKKTTDGGTTGMRGSAFTYELASGDVGASISVVATSVTSTNDMILAVGVAKGATVGTVTHVFAEAATAISGSVTLADDGAGIFAAAFGQDTWFSPAFPTWTNATLDDEMAFDDTNATSALANDLSAGSRTVTLTPDASATSGRRVLMIFPLEAV